MTITKTILTAAVISFGVAGAAQADDDKKFNGLYGGIEAGLDFTKLGGDVKRDRSLYYGGVLGYRSQLDSGLVVGIEGTLGDTGYQNNAAGIGSKYEWSTSLTLGTAFGDDGNNLIYGKAGYVRGRFNPAGENNAFNNGGWRFGGGYERSLTENVSLRLSGDYTTYGDDANGNSANGWAAKTGLIFKF